MNYIIIGSGRFNEDIALSRKRKAAGSQRPHVLTGFFILR